MYHHRTVVNYLTLSKPCMMRPMLYLLFVGFYCKALDQVTAENAYIMVPPSNTTTREGTRVKLTCKAEAFPGNISYHWSRDGVDVFLLTSLMTRVGVFADGALIISSVRAEDTGWYQCQPSNGLGQAPSAQAFLNVTFMPRVQGSLPSTVYLPLGMTGQLDCPTESNPPITQITWSKNGQPLNAIQYQQHMDDPQGAAPALDPRYYGPTESAYLQHIRINKHGSLILRPVLPSDGGQYSCTPQSSIGVGQTSPLIHVLVRDDQWRLPDNIGSPTSNTSKVNPFSQVLRIHHIQRRSVRKSANVGGSVTLDCDINYPDGQYTEHIIKWHKQGIELPIYIQLDSIPAHVDPKYEGRARVIDRASIEINQLRETDEGWYECSVVFIEKTDDINRNGTWVYLAVTESQPQPAPPEKLKVEQFHGMDLNISWQAPVNSPVSIDSYTIQYRTVGPWLTLVTEHFGTWYVWRTASPGATYRFRVISVHTVESESSDEVNIQIKLDNTSYTAIDSPTNVEVRRISPTALKVSWDPPKAQTVPGYRVYYNYYDDTHMENWMSVDITYFNEFELTGLEPNETYVVRVAAMDQYGRLSVPSDMALPTAAIKDLTN